MFDNPDAAFFQGALSGSRNNVRQAVSEIHKGNATIASLNAQLTQAWENMRLLEAENARLDVLASTARMDRAGLIAQFDTLKAQHPSSPLFADSGKRFKSGKTKTNIRLVFEAAFDAKGVEMNIANPAARRLD